MKTKTYFNNLRLVVNTKKDTNIVSFNIFVGIGSKDDPSGSYGMAHFLEHMFFKSTKTKKYQEILNQLDNMGVSHNAYTSTTKTCYYFKCISSVLEPSVQLFSEMFFNTSFNRNEVEKEKKVILEEYKMDEDDQSKKAISNAFENIFYNNEFGHSIIGNPTSIKSITSEKLKRFKEKYLPSRVVISISGNISFKKAEKLVKKYFADKFGKEKTEIEYNKYQNINIKSKYIAKQKDNKQSVVYILYDFKEPDLKTISMYKIYFSILGDGLSSKFMSKIRNELGLVYDIDAGASRMGKNLMGEIMFATSNEYVKLAIKAIKEILDSCANGEIDKEELERAKNKLLTSIAFSNESNSSIASSNGSSILSKGYIRTDKEIEQEVNSITIQDIKRVAIEVASNQNFVVSSVGKCKKQDLMF
ncbi:MAG: insulinase family protein [Clostridia bacterium]|nr:insulinase family protein [Clostridia bacterium]